jgi:hypothetical protein
VAAAVRVELDLPDTDPVIPERVELVTAQDNLVFVVVGHSTDPEDAANAANTAAGTLTTELNKYKELLGTFAIQKGATPPVRPVASVSPKLVVLAGLLAGLVLGVGIVAALLVWRRPVLSGGAAGQVVGVPVLGTLEVDPKAGEVRGLPHLYSRLLRRSACVVYLTEVRPNGDDVPLIAEGLRGLARQSLAEQQHDPTHSGFTVVEDASPTPLAARAGDSLTLLLVPVGTPEASLRREAELEVETDSTAIVVVRRASGPRGRTGSQRGAKVGSKDSATTSQ